MPLTLIRRAAAAIAAIVLSATAAAQSQVGPSFLGSISNLNDSIGDSFALASQPPPSSNSLYNFTDVYTFTFTGYTGNASGSVISFANMLASSISNLQAAVFLLSTSQFASTGPGTYLSSQGDTSGALNPWMTMNLGTGSASTFSTTDSLIMGDSYAVEVRGFLNSGSGSYGGNLVISSVPEPSPLALLLIGLAVIPLITRRRQ